MIGFGVPAGANRPMKFCAIMPGARLRPRSGCRARPRRGPRLVTARILSLPVLCSSMTCPVTFGVIIGMCPEMASVIASPAPRYGTCTMIGRADQRLEQFAGEMRHGSGASRPVGELAGIGLGVSDQLLERLHRHRRMHRDAHGGDAEDRDRLEVLERIVLGVAVGDRNDDLRAAAAEQDGVAVRLGAGDLGSGERAPRAADVLRHHDAEKRAASCRPMDGRSRRARRPAGTGSPAGWDARDIWTERTRNGAPSRPTAAERPSIRTSRRFIASFLFAGLRDRTGVPHSSFSPIDLMIGAQRAISSLTRRPA